MGNHSGLFLLLTGQIMKKLPLEECKREITFAAPPLGLKTCNIRDLYPLEEDEDSQLITDSSCKMIYLAHKNTSKITIAFTNLGILFSKSLGINYFREKLIINNWIDSIILLPPEYSLILQFRGIISIKKR